MLVSTIIPVRYVSIPAHAQVEAVFATVHSPRFGTLGGDPVRVRVESVRWVNILGQGGEPPYRVASVCVAPQCLPFDMRLSDLRNVSAFCSQEVE